MRVEDVGQGQRHQHLGDDLPARGAQGLRGLDVLLVDAGDGLVRGRDHEGTQATKMNITFCSSSMPNHISVSGSERRHRHVAAERPPAGRGRRRSGRKQPARTPSGTPTERRQAEALEHAHQAGHGVAGERPVEPEAARRSRTPRPGCRSRSRPTMRCSAAPRVDEPPPEQQDEPQAERQPHQQPQQRAAAPGAA